MAPQFMLYSGQNSGTTQCDSIQLSSVLADTHQQYSSKTGFRPLLSSRGSWRWIWGLEIIFNTDTESSQIKCAGLLYLKWLRWQHSSMPNEGGTNQ